MTKIEDKAFPVIYVGYGFNTLWTMQGKTRRWKSSFAEDQYYQGDSKPHYPMPALPYCVLWANLWGMYITDGDHIVWSYCWQ